MSRTHHQLMELTTIMPLDTSLLYEESGNKQSNTVVLHSQGGPQAHLSLTSFKDMDLSKVIYAYGRHDVAVGSLTDEEVRFLEEHNVTVYSVGDDANRAGGQQYVS